MAIKGCKTIAEFYFRRWMEKWDFVNGYFTLEVKGNEGVIKDGDGKTLMLIYDDIEHCVRVKG